MRIAVLRSAFNAPVVDGLLAGAREALDRAGLAPDHLRVVDVPGAFELPLAAQAAAGSGQYDAVIALGAVIRGDTDHYEHIARECAAGLSAVARETGVPVAFGVLTVRDEAQARVRSAPGEANKGAEAARAAVAMVRVLQAFGATAGRRRGAPAPKKARPAGRSAGPGNAAKKRLRKDSSSTKRVPRG